VNPYVATPYARRITGITIDVGGGVNIMA